MKTLIQRNYKAVKARGLINKDTLLADFIDKIEEEFKETDLAFYQQKQLDIPEKKLLEESLDICAVVFSMFKFYGLDFEELFEKYVVEKNEKRAEIKNNIDND